MTTNPPILRNSLLATPIAALAGLASSVPDALTAVVSSLMVLGNLWVLSILGPRLVRAIANGESPVLWLAALAAKFVLLILIWVAMLRTLPTFGLVMGFVPMMIGTLVAGIQSALHPPPDGEK